MPEVLGPFSSDPRDAVDPRARSLAVNRDGVRVRLPDGRIAEFPQGTSESDMADALLRVPPVQKATEAPQASPVSPQNAPGTVIGGTPKGPLGVRGVLAAEAQRLRQGQGGPLAALGRIAGLSPEAAGQVNRGAQDVAISVAAPNPASFLGRAGLQGGLSAVQSALSGGTPGDIVGRGALGAGLQGVAEAPFQAARLGFNALKAAQVQKGLEVAGKEFTETAVRQAKEFATQSRDFASQAAGTISSKIKAAVPALKSFSSDESGLISILFGRGRRVVGQQFDDAMKAAARKADAAKPLTILARDAADLKIPIQGRAPSPTDPLGLAAVNAKDVLGAAVGQWRKNPGLYRRVVDSLDKAGIGDPAARAQYKAWAGLKDFADRSGIIQFDTETRKFVFDPTRAAKGLVNPRANAALERRGLGNVEEGPVTAALGGPLKPIPGTPPPTSLADVPGFKTRAFPLAGHPFIGGMAAEAISRGATGSFGGGIPFLLGAAASQALPRQLVTQAPLDPQVIQLLTRSPSLLNALARAVPPIGPQ